MRTLTTREIRQWFVRSLAIQQIEGKDARGHSTERKSRSANLPFRFPQTNFRFFSTSDLKRKAVDLLDQQIWCWGQDISRSGGNLLLEMGFNRRRSLDQSSCYFGPTPEGGMIALWGFGILFSSPLGGTIFLARYEFEPHYSPIQNPHLDEQWDFLKSFGPPENTGELSATRKLVAGFCEWASKYEHWILEKEGISYREGCLSQRTKAPRIGPGDMAPGWEALSKKAREAQGGYGFSHNWGRLLDPVKRQQHDAYLSKVDSLRSYHNKEKRRIYDFKQL